MDTKWVNYQGPLALHLHHRCENEPEYQARLGSLGTLGSARLYSLPIFEGSACSLGSSARLGSLGSSARLGSAREPKKASRAELFRQNCSKKLVFSTFFGKKARFKKNSKTKARLGSALWEGRLGSIGVQKSTARHGTARHGTRAVPTF